MLWEKRYVFKSFLKTASEVASLMVIGSIFHRRGPMTKKTIACGTVSFGNVEPSMISLRMEVMMRTTLSVKCYAKQYQRKGRENVSWWRFYSAFALVFNTIVHHPKSLQQATVFCIYWNRLWKIENSRIIH